MKFAKIFTLILIISSFFPIIQITFLYTNGGLISLCQEVMGSDSRFISIILNLLFAAIFIFLYYKSEKLISKIISATLISFFVNSLVVFTNIQFNGNEEGNFYFIQFIVASVIVGTIILSTEYYRIFKN
ncbi:hypothetical protein SAMN05443292_2774 [Halpernia frigidisoli]|uniref:Uncharacterized protein n=1 Tax=Halpernia frigidisoli TaxID=1125876 RepID=A0A1I3ITI2_9FLAO|nr:hypothetical protein SAMN05443292_2774 [Halpernia frigidisoli]